MKMDTGTVPGVPGVHLDITTDDERKALATLEYEKDKNISKKWKNADGSLVDFCGIK